MENNNKSIEQLLKDNSCYFCNYTKDCINCNLHDRNIDINSTCSDFEINDLLK